MWEAEEAPRHQQTQNWGRRAWHGTHQDPQPLPYGALEHWSQRHPPRPHPRGPWPTAPIRCWGNPTGHYPELERAGRVRRWHPCLWEPQQPQPQARLGLTCESRRNACACCRADENSGLCCAPAWKRQRRRGRYKPARLNCFPGDPGTSCRHWETGANPPEPQALPLLLTSQEDVMEKQRR